jgi:serine/threonine protein kinase
VKKLNLKPGLEEEEFKNEFNKLRRIRHRNVTRLVAYCRHIEQVPVEHNGEYVSARVEERALCFEYLEGQSLDKHLSNEPCGLPWYICYRIIRGICEGLHYLHKGLKHPIYHLDLKPTNIFLDRDMMPQIGGFGLSLFDSLETNNTSEDMETSVHMPPEYINKQQISPKFDVFSLGVIIIQIMAGNQSFSKCADTPPEEFIQHVHQFWEKGTPETSWRYTSREVRTCIEIALKCVKSDLVMRPTMTEILDKLNKIYTADCSSIDQLYRTREFTLEFLEHITNKFSMQSIVGRGAYGVIYKNPCAITTRDLQQGVLDNGEEIAVKKLHQMLWIDNEQFKNELNNLMRLQHKNIVRLVGYCHNIAQILVEYKGELVSARVEDRALCLEYLQGGSLDKHISDEACRLDWDTCYKIIIGICEGLDYLHNGSEGPIYHLDLKPANILLDKDMVPKIGDFGLSRLFDSIQTYMTQSQDVTGTRGYMPPEYINKGKISQKFDVFSLGVIIIQMMAGMEAYFDCADTPPEEFIKLVHGTWRKRLLQSSTVSYHASQEVRTCIEIALRCVEADRGQRPTITEIVNELSNIGTTKSLPVDQWPPKKLTARRTSLLFTHFKYWLPLLIALVAIFLAWPQLCPESWSRQT